MEIERKIIVLDDDPTGVQTVNGVNVYTEWTDNGVYASKKSAGNAVTFSSSSNLFDGEI